MSSSRFTYFVFLSSYLLLSCSTQKKINSIALQNVLQVDGLRNAHIGISIYDPAANKYLYNYQADKYFVPASNTKLFTCYAGMKYLGDSLTGIRYLDTGNDLLLLPAGDPTFLHPEFKKQPVVDFLKASRRSSFISDANWKDESLGFGWSWDDYNSSYMAERSPLPVYGNVIKFVQTQTPAKEGSFDNKPEVSVYTDPEIDWKLSFNPDTSSRTFYVERKKDENVFMVTQGLEKFKEQEIPFSTRGLESALALLKDNIDKSITLSPDKRLTPIPYAKFQVIHSQPVDSLFRPMMHRSDNFFAEQTLLMVSNERLGVMSDSRIVDTLLKTDLKDLPQKPRWVDGSGLSRYNMFTPQDFVFLLNKMRQEFAWQRIIDILPTGNEGTLTNYYKSDSSFIYAKTGTLSGHVALSGFLITRKNKTLIFSVLVNNHQTSATNVRRSVERFIEKIRNSY
jgi:serine-type D-Ala-D-Ala carboxypeptidase/endopeptidase (penicillin-binding protein 4)